MKKKPKIYRIWLFNHNDRREIARIKAFNFETVQQYLLKEFIKPEHKEDIELTEFGLLWLEYTPEQCLENVDLEAEGYKTLRDLKEAYENDEYNPCEFCDGCIAGFQIDEYELGTLKESFKTIYGTNEFYDLTGKRPRKAKDTDKDLKEAWEKSPQLGVAQLILSTIRDNPELEGAFSKELIEDSQRKLKEAKKETKNV